VAADDIFALRSAIDKVVNFGDRAVEAGHGKALAFHIQNEILAHYRKTYKTNICTSHF
jgi:hypothetical protein